VLQGRVFQGAMNALNPVRTVGSQVVEAIRTHDESISQKNALTRAGEPSPSRWSSMSIAMTCVNALWMLWKVPVSPHPRSSSTGDPTS
jgi:ABC-type dipeptide/oligopeptide/nickel transport system ATPase component